MTGGVVVVAPPDAAWAEQATSALADARIFVARLYEASLLPLLVHSGGVAAVAIDAKLASTSDRALRGLAVRVVWTDAWSPAVLQRLVGGAP